MVIEGNMIYKTKQGKDQVLNFYKHIISKWPVEMESINIDTDYGQTHIIRSGIESKPKLLLLHGTGSNSASWMKDVITYSKDFDVYCVDIPGEAGLSSNDRFSLNRDCFNAWIDQVITHLNLNKVSIIGQSLGGWIGLNYSIFKPEKIASLSLISPSGIIEAKFGYFLSFVFYSLLGKWGQNRIKRMIESEFELTGDAKEFFMLTLHHFIYRTERPELFNDEELKRLSIPLYYIGGLKDPLLNTRKTADRLMKLVKGCKVYIDDSSHVLIDNAERISSFITAVDS